MLFNIQVLAVGLLAAGTAVKVAASTQGHRVNQIKNPKGRHTAVRMTYNMYLKYGVKPPAMLTATVNTGNVPAVPSDQYDDAYIEPVTIGNQNLNLDFDTGSSDLWVFSTYLPASEVNGQTLYNNNTSPTYKNSPGETWTIMYGDSSSSGGFVGLDKVIVGGATVTSQAVECATSVSSSFTAESDSDGLLGLSFDSLNTCSPKTCETYFDNLAPTLPLPLFTADLRYHATGSYDFGYLDSTKYIAPISYMAAQNATAITSGFWGFGGQGFAVGCNTDISYTFSGAIADTGTTLLYTDAAIVEAYYASVSGAAPDPVQGGLYSFPCTSTLPDLTFVINGYRATVPGKYINFEAYQDTPGTTLCLGGLQIADFGVPMSVFGDVFLKSQFVVFDTCGPQLGFAAKPNAVSDQASVCPGTTRVAATASTVLNGACFGSSTGTSTSTSTSTSPSTSPSTSTSTSISSTITSTTISTLTSTSTSTTTTSSTTMVTSTSHATTKTSTSRMITLAPEPTPSKCAADNCYRGVVAYERSGRYAHRFCHEYLEGKAAVPRAVATCGSHRISSACHCLTATAR